MNKEFHYHRYTILPVSTKLRLVKLNLMSNE